MKILLVGYSSIAARRILPALDTLGLVNIDIATSRPDEVDVSQYRTPCTVFSGYEEGIRASNAEYCYISTINSAHYTHAKLALETGKHTIVDKPIAMQMSGAKELVALSRAKSRLLAEAVVYLDHGRIKGTMAKLKELDYRPRHITSTFCFPPLSKENFRNDPASGGGAVLDLGAYMVSPGRYFFETSPAMVEAWPTEFQNGMTAGIHVVIMYTSGRSFSGYYSFEGEYQNEMTVSGKNFFVRFERFFTTPPDMETSACGRRDNAECKWIFPADDAFSSWLKRILSIRDEEAMEEERRIIMEDQKTLTLIRQKLEDNSKKSRNGLSGDALEREKP